MKKQTSNKERYQISQYFVPLFSQSTKGPWEQLPPKVLAHKLNTNFVQSVI